MFVFICLSGTVSKSHQVSISPKDGPRELQEGAEKRFERAPRAIRAAHFQVSSARRFLLGILQGAGTEIKDPPSLESRGSRWHRGKDSHKEGHDGPN